MKKSLVISLPILVLILAALACNRKSASKDAEVVYAPTEIGTPVGDKMTKVIGAAGGTLSSPDGRLTLTVPPNALSETTTFAIQPITNKMGNGLGSAYRLEPDGKTFATALQISFHYGDQDLAGTVPEALAIAYQDNKGSWRAPRAKKLDQNARTLTISTTHFTNWGLLANARLIPTEAKVYVGKSLNINLLQCPSAAFTSQCAYARTQIGKWKVRGEGTIKSMPTSEGVTYTAPARKPSPNVAWVTVDFETEDWNEKTGELTKTLKTYAAKITILDFGYQATGQTGDLRYSGVICGLDKPFTVDGSIYDYKFNFTPSSGTAGTFTLSMGGHMVHGEGGGNYVIEGLDGDKPRIAMTGTATGHSPVGSITRSGASYIDLIPLNANECGGKN